MAVGCDVRYALAVGDPMRNHLDHGDALCCSDTYMNLKKWARLPMTHSCSG